MRNLSRQIYAGLNTGNVKNNLPEAEIIPFGESVNEKRKIDKVASKYSALFEHDNIPLPGFTLYKTGRKRFGSLDQSWLVIDPRGFLVRITNDNLEKILEVTGITEGLIQDKCVWIRENNQTKMTLIPISSSEYTDALKNTEMLEDKVNIKDLQIGDKVLLQNKLSGTFLGTVSLYGPIINYSSTKDHFPQSYPRRQILEVDNGKYYYQSDLKILKILESVKVPIEKQIVADELNRQISNGAILTPYNDFKYSNHLSRGNVRLASTKTTKITMSFEEINIHEATVLFIDACIRNDMGELLLTDDNGINFIIEFDSYGAASASNFTSFQILKVKNKIEVCDALTLAESRKYWSNKNPISYHSLTEFKKFYKIVKHVGTLSY